ncbi:MAG: hypothetical protein WCI37_01285 [bacterium]
MGLFSKPKTFKSIAKQMGLNSEQTERLKTSLVQGGDAVTITIKELQDEQRLVLKENGIDYSNITPEIGREMSWDSILSMAFKVTDFDRNNTQITDAGEVKASSAREPYGYLLVESPTLDQAVTLPIIHRDDFMLASSVLDDTDVMEANESLGRELLVTYQPEKTTKDGRSATPAHCLHYALVPNGTLENYYSDDKRMARPEPELLFGRFVYSGAISVFMNTAPRI